MANQEKRKRTVLSVEQKLSLIAKFERGVSTTNLSREFGIGQQTVRDIVKQLQSIVRNCDSSTGPSQRKTMKTSTYENLDVALLTWFIQKRSEGVPITIFTEKAKYFNEKMGG